ncbi:MAG: lysophospholipid acyltransferase family protein [Isosphaeraceae bacterium]
MSEPVASQTSPAGAGEGEHAPRRPRSDGTGAGTDRRWGELLWYRLVQYMFATLFAALGGWRASGWHNMPATGAVLLVANHLSFLDVFLLGISLRRPLNFVARSSLFFPVLGFLIRSVGGFPIQREGMGASGMKETLRRLRRGGIVTLFPEGTRSRDGKLAPLKSGIAVLVSRAGVPVVPAGIAGTFEAWPRSRLLPVPRPVRIHFGPPIRPEDIAGMESQAVTALIRDRLQDCVRVAQEGLARDLNHLNSQDRDTDRLTLA